MSTNKVDKTTGELHVLANGARIWLGTKAAHDAAVQAGTLPNNCILGILDDWEDSTVDVVEDGNMHPVTSNAVADAVGEIGSLTELLKGNFVSNEEHLLDLTDYRGIYICVRHDSTNITKYDNYTLYVAKELLDSTKRRFWTTGYYQNSSSNYSAAFLISLTSIQFAFSVVNGSTPSTFYAVVYGVK